MQKGKIVNIVIVIVIEDFAVLYFEIEEKSKTKTKKHINTR